jgi:hypothetical protein
MRSDRVAVAVAASIWLVACAEMRVDMPQSVGDEKLYASLYPYYAEFCAVSQLKKKPGFTADISSGIGGHSVLYLNGVCRDASAGYPTIKVCNAGANVADHGVGLSVNAHFKNANWIATEGKNFFFHGTLAPNQRLTRAEYRNTQARAKAMGILDGVEFHSEAFDDMPPDMPRDDYMYDVSIATDYAIGFGRDRYCALVPLSREKMTRVVDYLNGLNAPYKNRTRNFEWNVLRNNCAHVTHNALATVGVWDKWETERFVVFSAFDFPVPKNEFVNLMRRTNDMPIERPDALYEDRAARQSLMQGDGLPTAAGALAEAESVVRDNDVYDTDLGLIFYDSPVFGSYQKRFRQIFSEPRYSDIRENLRYFSVRYAEIEAKAQPADTPPADQGFATFHAKYRDYIDQASAEVRAVLTALGAPAEAGEKMSRAGGPGR